MTNFEYFTKPIIHFGNAGVQAPAAVETTNQPNGGGE